MLVCQFELPTSQFVRRLSPCAKAIGAAADQQPTRGHATRPGICSAPRRDWITSSSAHRSAEADVIVLDPLYSTHDQDENDTRAMAALCQTLLRLRDASHAALIVVHHVRKSIGRHEIGSAFRGSSALHAVGDSYLLLARPSPQIPTVELRFQFRYAPAQQPRLLTLDAGTLWFEPSNALPTPFKLAAKSKPPTSNGRRRFRFSSLQSTPATDHDRSSARAEPLNWQYSVLVARVPSSRTTDNTVCLSTTSPRVAPR